LNKCGNGSAKIKFLENHIIFIFSNNLGNPTIAATLPSLNNSKSVSQFLLELANNLLYQL